MTREIKTGLVFVLSLILACAAFGWCVTFWTLSAPALLIGAVAAWVCWRTVEA